MALQVLASFSRSRERDDAKIVARLAKIALAQNELDTLLLDPSQASTPEERAHAKKLKAR